MDEDTKKKAEATPLEEVELYQKEYATVGEFVLLSNMLDYKMTQILIDICHLNKTTLLIPILSMLEASKKQDIIRARAKNIKGGKDTSKYYEEWRSRTIDFLDECKELFEFRNIVCHTPVQLNNGKWYFKVMNANKLLYKIAKGNAESELEISFDVLDQKIRKAEETIALANVLLENLERFRSEIAARAKKDQ